MVSGLPEPLFERHQRIYNDALKAAREAGWDGSVETSGDS